MLDSPYPCFLRSSPFSPFLAARLVRLDWFPLRTSSSQGEAKRTRLPRLLKPRTPDDCPACRLASTALSAGGPALVPVRPWSEVKSRRGAPKRIDTGGFACPNPQCTYFENTEAHVHALVGNGKHGSAERIQTFRFQSCRTTFTSRPQQASRRETRPRYGILLLS